MELLNIKSAYALANTLYDVSISETEFEEIALNAWDLIGTKHTRLYKLVADSNLCEIQLPCNCDVIESVTIPISDAQLSSPSDDFITDNVLTEKYIDSVSKFKDLYYQSGKFVKYKQIGNTLVFSKDFHNVCIVYHGVECDEDGLPLINDKEMRAIAAYVAYATTYKEGLKRRDPNILNLAQTIYTDWLRFCNAARIPNHFSQNDMDSILDAKLSWNRKIYNKSFHPIR